MSVRKPGLDPTTAELARRRLSQLGADLSASATTTAPTVTAPAAEPPVAPQVTHPRAGRHAGARLSLAGRVVARAGDALPAALQGRIGVTAQHVTVVALVLAAAMALAAWLVLRSVPEPAPTPRQASLRLPPPTPLAPVGAPSPAMPAMPASPAAPAASAAAVVVHVTGKVRRPGVVELPGGSRVIDAIEEAGGARPGVRLGTLNLARLVVDGEQIAVGVQTAVVPPPAGTGPPPDTATSGVPGALVDLNTATQLQLEELPGVGPVTATSIIEWRTEHGGFTTVDELLEVSGIGEVTLAELRDLVTV